MAALYSHVDYLSVSFEMFFAVIQVIWLSFSDSSGKCDVMIVVVSRSLEPGSEFFMFC